MVNKLLLVFLLTENIVVSSWERNKLVDFLQDQYTYPQHHLQIQI